MKIAKHIIGFVGGFVIGALGALVLVDKEFDKEPKVVGSIDDTWYEELPF
jgi:hypothetical protein